MRLMSVSHTQSVFITPLCHVRHIPAVVALKSPLINASNPSNITWSLLRNYSSASSGPHIIYLPEADYQYTVELSGGHCLGSEPQQVNVTSTHCQLLVYKCQQTPSNDIIVHGGANYTVRVRAWSFDADGMVDNFSEAKLFTTQTEGISLITYITFTAV